MRYVLDQNFAQKKELDFILDAGNEIVIGDDFLLEPFRATSPAPILIHNLQTLRKYPNQVHIAFGIKELIKIEAAQGKPLNKDQLIAADRTSFVRNLLSMSDSSFQKKVESMETEGKRRIQVAADFTEKFIREIAGITQAKMKEVEPLSQYKANQSKFIEDLAVASYKMMYNTLKDVDPSAGISLDFMPNISVSFAFCFAFIWRVVDWSIRDGFQNANIAMRGDIFDIHYLTISAMCDGILTHDKWINDCRSDLVSIFQAP